jgi:hypothetical protein
MDTQPLFVVVESTPVGESVIGVFSSIEAARAVLPDVATGRLGDYRIEVHVLDAPLDVYSAWQVSLDYEGDVISAEPLISCACCDEDASIRQASFIEAGGELLRLAVWARTRGGAIAAASAYARRLIDDGLWQRGMTLTPVPPIHTEAAA